MIFAGNGGSFADAQHLCAEFVSRLIEDRAPMSAVVLGVNGSNISAIGNDYGYENVFARELSTLYRTGDVFLGISTSGKSKNILKAIDVALDIGCITILLTGERKAEINSDVLVLNVPSIETMHVQEAHIMVGHIICELVENTVLEKNK